MKNFFRFIIIFMICFLTGCTSAKISQKERNNRLSKIKTFYTEWKGTKYKYGGQSKKGVDCSGLVGIFFKEEYNKSIPRTTLEIAKEGEEVSSISDLEVGDIVLFKIRRKVYHTGLYIGNGKFLHSSTQKGVMISMFDDYWLKKYWQSRRILQ
ncbi:C40 family peptidase [Cetobacterium sp. SF1]|uniref:C40 family peptidase n=1 Tax=unclassified Cetobacterium TaxID=2630983 RepID=UPI003CED4745